MYIYSRQLDDLTLDLNQLTPGRYASKPCVHPR